MLKNHPKAVLVEKEHNNRKAGEAGEKSVDYYLRRLSDKDNFIFHGLRLLNGETYFQMDTLLITPRYQLIMEVKNLAGTLHFEKKFSQFTRTINGIQERYKNPILQAQRQRGELSIWLEHNHFPELPIEYLFVNSNEKSIITADSGYDLAFRYACNSDCLLQKISQISNKYHDEKLSPKEIRKLSRLLLNKHTPEDKNILESFNLTSADIVTGVECPNCHSYPMKYKRCNWICSLCHEKSADAHIKAIEDYFLLINPSINNSELKEFLHLSSSNIAYKLLISLDLSYTGTFKNRIYFPK